MEATKTELELLRTSAKNWGKVDDKALAEDPQAGAIAAVLTRMTIDLARMQAAVSTPEARKGRASEKVHPGQNGKAAQLLSNLLTELLGYLPAKPMKAGEPSMQEVATQLSMALKDIHDRGGLPVPADRGLEGRKPAAQRADILVAAMAEDLHMLAQLSKQGVDEKQLEQLHKAYASSAVQEARDSGAPSLHSLWKLTKGDVALRQCLLDPKHPLHKTMLQLADASSTPGDTDKERIVRYLTKMSLSLQPREAMSVSASKSKIFGTPLAIVDPSDLLATLGLFLSGSREKRRSDYAAVEDFSGLTGGRQLGSVLFALGEHINALQAGIGWSPVPILTRLGIGIGGTNVRVSGAAAQSLMLEESTADYWRAFLDGAGPVKLYNQSGVWAREFAEISGHGNSIGLQLSGAVRLPWLTPRQDGSGGSGFLRALAAWTGISYGSSFTRWEDYSPTGNYSAHEKYPDERFTAGVGVAVGQPDVTHLTPAIDPMGLQAGVNINTALIALSASGTVGAQQKTINQYCDATAVKAAETKDAVQALRAQVQACGEGKEAWLAELDGLLDEKGEPAADWAQKADDLCRRLEQNPPSWQDPNTAVELESTRRQLLTLALWQQQSDAGVMVRIRGPRQELRLQAPWQVQEVLIKKLASFLGKVEPDRVSQATVDMTLTEDAERRMHAMLLAGARQGIPKDIVLAHIDRHVLCELQSYQVPAWRVSYMLTGVVGHDSGLPTPLVQSRQGGRFTTRILSAPHGMEGRRLVVLPAIGNQVSLVQTGTEVPWIYTPTAAEQEPRMQPESKPRDLPPSGQQPVPPKQTPIANNPFPNRLLSMPGINIPEPADMATSDRGPGVFSLAQQQPIPPALTPPPSESEVPPAKEVPAPPSDETVNPFSSFSEPSGPRDPRLNEETRAHLPAEETWSDWFYRLGGTATNAARDGADVAWKGATAALGAAGTVAGRLLTGLAALYTDARGGPALRVHANPQPETEPETKADPFKTAFPQAKHTDFTFRDLA
jgi:hypothetical protein